MRVLIWHHKHGDYLFNASIKAKEQAAMRAIFKMMDEEGFYFEEEKTRLEQARAGDFAAIAAILHERDQYEYEEWEVVEVNNPDAEAQPWDIDGAGFDDYQKAAHGTAIYPQDAGISYAALGLAGEAGEVANQVKKIIRDDGGTPTRERKAAIAKELGDGLWYFAEVATKLGLQLSDIAKANLKKLYDRKDRGTLQGDGDNR